MLRQTLLPSRAVVSTALLVVLFCSAAACRRQSPVVESPAADSEGSSSAPPTLSVDAAVTAPPLGPARAPERSVLVSGAIAVPAPDAEACVKLESALSEVPTYPGGSVEISEFVADLQSADVRTRASALSRIESVGVESTDLLDPLQSIARSGDANARTRALELLSRIDAASAVTIATEMTSTGSAGRQSRLVGASALARLGRSGLSALMPLFAGEDAELRREFDQVLPRAAAYPVAARQALFDTGSFCSDLHSEGCRDLFRLLLVAEPSWSDAIAATSPVAAMLVAEASADIDANALAEWSRLAADPAVPIGQVRESMIALRMRGLATELRPALLRLLPEPSTFGPRTVSALLSIAPQLSDSLPALAQCATVSENLEVSAVCAATWSAAGGVEASPELRARLEAIVAQDAPARAVSGRLAAMVLMRIGGAGADAPWLSRFDAPTRAMLTALASDDADAVARALNSAELDARTAVRGAVVWGSSRLDELAAAVGRLESLNTADARWLEVAAVSGAAFVNMAPTLANVLSQAGPSPGAVHWLASNGQRDAAVAWVDRAIQGDDYGARHSAILVARRASVAIDSAFLTELLTRRDEQSRVETAAYRVDIARLLIALGGLSAAAFEQGRTSAGDAAPGFAELGLVGAQLLGRCQE